MAITREAVRDAAFQLLAHRLTDYGLIGQITDSLRDIKLGDPVAGREEAFQIVKDHVEALVLSLDYLPADRRGLVKHSREKADAD